MSAIFRLLAALCVGVVHFMLALMLGPGLNFHCASTGECIVDLSGDFPAKAVFAFPLSLGGNRLQAIFHDHSFAFYAAFNAFAVALLLWAALSLLARAAQRR